MGRFENIVISEAEKVDEVHKKRVSRIKVIRTDEIMIVRVIHPHDFIPYVPWFAKRTKGNELSGDAILAKRLKKEEYKAKKKKEALLNKEQDKGLEEWFSLDSAKKLKPLKRNSHPNWKNRLSLDDLEYIMCRI